MSARLVVEDVTVAFPGWPPLEAVRSVSFELAAGEVCGLVGESGSGKSTLAAALLGLVPGRGRVTSGSIRFEGDDVTRMDEAELRALRGRRMAMVFQDHADALSPLMTVGSHLREALTLSRAMPRRARRPAALELLREVAISDPERRLGQYPHELSGGIRQRLLLALALAGDPDLLIADEPTTALDVTVQAQILELLRTRQRERGLTLLLISHALPLVASTVDRVIVMYGGRLMESAPAAELFGAPRHPYTAALLEANPDVDRDTKISAIPGAPPSPDRMPPGCPFAPRCAYAREVSYAAPPEPVEVGPGHLLACPVDPFGKARA